MNCLFIKRYQDTIFIRNNQFNWFYLFILYESSQYRRNDGIFFGANSHEKLTRHIKSIVKARIAIIIFIINSAYQMMWCFNRFLICFLTLYLSFQINKIQFSDHQKKIINYYDWWWWWWTALIHINRLKFYYILKWPKWKSKQQISTFNCN